MEYLGTSTDNDVESTIDVIDYVFVRGSSEYQQA